MNYPELLGASDVAKICGCSRPTAYVIMNEPHRPQWRKGKMLRLHRDLFLEQLRQESSKHLGA